MRNLIFILLVSILASCSAEKRLERKYNRLQKFAKKTDQVIQDSVLVSVHDTIITETIRKDTVFSKETFYERLRDTVVIVNDRLTIRQYYNNTTDSILIEGECLGDSIPYEKEVYVPVDKIVVTEGKTAWWKILLSGILGIVIGLIVVGMVHRILK